MRQNDKIMCILENRKKRDRKNLCRAISDFQRSFQKPETRREFDLSDPLALKNDIPARQSDHDVRNTISGMQKFMGEDLNFHERKKFQEEQNREWSLQQQREWKNAQAERKHAGNEAEGTAWTPCSLPQTTPPFFWVVLFCFLLCFLKQPYSFCVFFFKSSCAQPHAALALWGRKSQSPPSRSETSPIAPQSSGKHFPGQVPVGCWHAKVTQNRPLAGHGGSSL